MAVYVTEQQTDLSLDLQYDNEGDVVGDASLFGTLVTASPTYLHIGRNRRWVYRDTPAAVPIQEIDDANRTSFKKIQNSGSLTIDFDLTDGLYDGDLDWFVTPNKTDFNSRTFLFSRNSGTEYYTVLKGCVPTRTTITFPEDNSPIHVSAEIAVTNPVDETTTDGLTTPVRAVPITADLICPSDAGLDPFLHNAIGYKTRGMTITIEMAYAMVDADDNTSTQLMIPSRATISGTVNIFKKTGADAIRTDIFARTVRTMSRILTPFVGPPNGSRLDFTAVDIEENEENNADIRTESTVKSYNFTAGTLVLAEITS